MLEAQHLADALQGLVANPEQGFFTAFTVATDGLTAAQAMAIPAPRFNSIWAVVNHVRFWQESTLLFRSDTCRACGSNAPRFIPKLNDDVVTAIISHYLDIEKHSFAL